MHSHEDLQTMIQINMVLLSQVPALPFFVIEKDVDDGMRCDQEGKILSVLHGDQYFLKE